MTSTMWRRMRAWRTWRTRRRRDRRTWRFCPQESGSRRTRSGSRPPT
uniref:Putative DNA directed RNA polymerase II polypeptide F variant 1 n=1 Tax=Taeniopygia guttata TaxID=59729 RepID=B5G122_TAEGU|nr:putative DNA directed RNA polymerase II polypeptide F variant 1 [Taeniopygia guttata]